MSDTFSEQLASDSIFFVISRASDVLGDKLTSQVMASLIITLRNDGCDQQKVRDVLVRTVNEALLDIDRIFKDL